MTIEQKVKARELVRYGARSGDVEGEKLITYFMFAERWGWTPKQVDEVDHVVIMMLREMLLEVEEIERRSREQEVNVQVKDLLKV